MERQSKNLRAKNEAAVGAAAPPRSAALLYRPRVNRVFAAFRRKNARSGCKAAGFASVPCAARPPCPRRFIFCDHLLIVLLGCLFFSCTGAPREQSAIQPQIPAPDVGEKTAEAASKLPPEEPESPAAAAPVEEEALPKEAPPEEEPAAILPEEELLKEEEPAVVLPEEELLAEEPPAEIPPEEPPPTEETVVVEESIPPEEAEQSPPEEISEAEELALVIPEEPDAESEPVIEKTDPPPGLAFTSTPLPALHSMPGIGRLSTSSGDRVARLTNTEKTDLTGAFRAAYQDALIRDLPLRGALGSDLIHGWPASSPLGWVQNWRSTQKKANSWGLPDLVLAVGGLTQDRVYALSGLILDQYGKSGGVNRTNGVPGYGAPLTGEFFWGDGIAQRFVQGLITLDRSGKSAFHAEEAPSSRETPPPVIGLYAGAYPPQGPETQAGLRKRFVAAWNAALDSGTPPLVPDGPVYYAGLQNAPWTISENGNRPIKLNGFYYQTYNRETAVFVLGISPELPPYPRLVSGAVLDLLIAWAHPIPGAETLQDDTLRPDETKSDASTDFVKALIRGMGLYGFPVSDRIPREDSEGAWLPAQRFSKGWISETNSRE
ncbi:MAG: hypothetical protein LBQ88_12790 [Treponema sp.]|jgi:hypothetical protein|nr:hypothetical protein [Treponema sp.]